MPYVYSTLSNNHRYAVYPKSIDARKVTHPVRTILIKGQANVADRTTLIAPKGAVTHVSKDDLETLKGIASFQRHMQRGFIHVDERKADVDRVAKDMTRKDLSSQLVDDDFDPERKPKLNKKAAL